MHNNTQLSPEDVDRMRALLAQHDANSRPGIKEFDLNNPPKLPYTHQEFPRVVYHQHKPSQVAGTPEEFAAALAAGWSKDPVAVEAAAAAPALDAAATAEVARLDAEARKKKAA